MRSKQTSIDVAHGFEDFGIDLGMGPWSISVMDPGPGELRHHHQGISRTDSRGSGTNQDARSAHPFEVDVIS